MGVSISDAVLILGKDLVLSGKLFNKFDRLTGLSAEKRRDALLNIASNVSIDADTGSVADSVSDFQVLVLRNSAMPLGDWHLRQYRVFLRDGTQVKVERTRYSGDDNRQVKGQKQRRDKGNLVSVLRKLRSSIERQEEGGLKQLIAAKELAITVEAISRELSVETSDTRLTLAHLQEEEMFDILWEHMDAARDAMITGSGLPAGFDAIAQSLMVFLGKP